LEQSWELSGWSWESCRRLLLFEKNQDGFI